LDASRSALANTHSPLVTNPIVHQENGSTAPFLGSGPLYTHPDRVLAELYQDPNNSTFVFTHTHGLTHYTFSPQGRLSQVQDRNGYATALTYDNDGRLLSVTDPAGRSLTFTYSCGMISSV